MFDTDGAASSRSGSVLRHPPFLLFLLSRTLSGLAIQMQAVAIGWQIYGLTGSALMLGLVGLAQFVPPLLLAFVVGHVADRFDRRLVLQVCQIVQGLAVAALAYGSYRSGLDPRGIFAAIVVIGCATAFVAPTRQAMLPALVPSGLMARAVSWSSAAGQASSICGPAFGGLLYVAGPGAVYAAAAVLIGLSAGSIALMRLERAVPSREPVTLASVFAGVSLVRRRPELLGAISLDLFAVLLGGATALLPIYAHDILRVGPWGLGALRSAPKVGALGMSFLLARIGINRHAGRIMFAAVGVFGVATIVFGLSRSFPLSIASLAVLGAADSISMIIRGSLVQLQTPNEMLGRVSSVYFIFVGTSNQLGEFESGVTASWFGAVPAVLIGGVGTLAVLVIWMWAFPALLNYDRLEEAR